MSEARERAAKFFAETPEFEGTIDEAFEAAREDERRSMAEKWGSSPDGPVSHFAQTLGRNAEAVKAIVGELVRKLEQAEHRLAAVVEALDPEELECDRLGLTCRSVSPADRWCRACRLTNALHGERP